MISVSLSLSLVVLFFFKKKKKTNFVTRCLLAALDE